MTHPPSNSTHRIETERDQSRLRVFRGQDLGVREVDTTSPIFDKAYTLDDLNSGVEDEFTFDAPDELQATIRVYGVPECPI